MMKKIALILLVLLLGFWAWPAQAGCNCGARPTYGSNPYPLGYWYGVDNSQSINNPFGDWYGVDNRQQLSNPFGDWYGVNNTVQTSNPFADWYGVNNSYQTGNPFGDWYGASNTVSYVTPRTTSPVAPTSYTAPVVYAPNTSQPAGTYFVAPTTGVDKVAPWAFGGLLVVGLFVIRKRKWLFN